MQCKHLGQMSQKFVFHLNNVFHELFGDTWGGQLGYLQQTVTQRYCNYYYNDNDNDYDDGNDNDNDNDN